MIIWKFSAFLPLFRPLIPVSCRSLKIAAERLLRQENFTSRFVSESTKKRISLHLSSLPPGLPPPRLSALIFCPSVSCVPISSFQVSRIPTFSLLPPASWLPASQLSVSRLSVSRPSTSWFPASQFSISCSPLLGFRPPGLPASHLSAHPVSYHSVSRVRPPPAFRSPGNPSQSRFPLRPSITLKSRRVLSHPAAFTLSLFGNPAPSLRLLRKRSLPPRPPLPSPRPPAEHGSTG